MGIHEEILRLVAFGDDDDEDKEQKLDDKDLLKNVAEHLRLLQRTYQRLGGWDEKSGNYEEIYQELAKDFSEKELGVPQPAKWSAATAKNADELGKYAPPATWEFKLRKAEGPAKRKPRSLVHRASANWGCRFDDVYAEMEGEAESEEE